MDACRITAQLYAAAGLFIGLGGAGATWAAEPGQGLPEPSPQIDASPVVTVYIDAGGPAPWVGAQTKPIDSIGRPVDVAWLAGIRGGEDSQESIVVVDGTVDGNTADRIISAGNSISDSAFNNASGINTVIQNSGTNVLIQNAMVVNVSFVEPGL